MKKYIYEIIVFLLIILGSLALCRTDVKADSNNGLMEVYATAYYDAYGHGYGADGRALVENLTIAGKREWLGMTAVLYDQNMTCIGIYEFRDVGYGVPTGKGKSNIIKGASLGTIETGQTVDIYKKTRKQCEAWGKKKVYMQLIKAVG